MDLKVEQVSLKDILPLRALFLKENHFQIRYDACHARGWTDSYLISTDGADIGYGSVKGKDDLSLRDAIFEFYLTPKNRKYANPAFEKLIKISLARFIECQSNDHLMASMIFEFSRRITSDVILFEDDQFAFLNISGAIFRKKMNGDKSFDHKSEPDGDYVIEADGEIVATGGFLLHYNHPFADLYMEVREDQRQKGYGSLMIQELRKACFDAGRVPAARCNITNKASKATLMKGGLRIAGYMLTGEIKPEHL
ncbi:MAG: GNAT family N-acetyltransferase [Mucilaginibacter sp.]|nr:GNAT family N-acetyltransferase [Mucilaginibacter sp.]